MKLTRAIIASVIFTAILLGIYYFHVNFFKVNVVFYAAIGDGVVAALLTGAILQFFSYFRVFGGFEKLQLIVIWLLLGYSFAISVPTVIDRSLSFYILEKLQQRGGGIKQENFEQVFTQEYVKEHHLVDVRLTEQLQSGTIVINDGCVTLTEKGQLIASFGRFFRTHWLPKQRLLMGKYSDALTDPFRNSVANVNYTCQLR
ncbi:hypothetical protein [Variovorax gossypii]